MNVVWWRFPRLVIAPRECMQAIPSFTRRPSLIITLPVEKNSWSRIHKSFLFLSVPWQAQNQRLVKELEPLLPCISQHSTLLYSWSWLFFWTQKCILLPTHVCYVALFFDTALVLWFLLPERWLRVDSWCECHCTPQFGNGIKSPASHGWCYQKSCQMPP